MEVDKIKRKNWIQILLIMLLILVLFFIFDHKKSIVSDNYEDYFTYRMMKAETENIHRVYRLTKENESKIVQIVAVNGYKSMIEMLVTIDVQKDLVEGVQIVDQHESHDYGAAITEDWFLDRLSQKDVRISLKTVKMRQENSNEIVAVTGATISSAAVVYGVNLCMENYSSMVK